MTPNIDDIRRDDDLLDRLGRRRALHRPDPAADALADWVRAIDAPARGTRPGRYSRSRRTRTRAGVIAAITVAATLSVSGVAAAVSGMPGFSGVAEQLGFVHRSSDFGSGAAGTMSSSAPSSTRSVSVPAPRSGNATVDVTPQLSRTSTLPRRVLPGALRRTPTTAAPTDHPTPSITSSAGTTPSSTSSSSAAASSTSSSTPTSPSTTSTSSSSPTSPKHSPTHTKKPPKPKPTPTPTPTTPGWGPISPTSTPSSTSETSPSETSSTSHGSSPAR